MHNNYCFKAKIMEDCKRNTAEVSLFRKIWNFYYFGFKEMTVGKTLWMIILAKLFIFFIVMKLLFFPNILSRDFDTDEERAEHVMHELTSPNK